MQYAHLLERAGAYARQAVDLMVEHKIPPHPNNFMVWYSYCAGDNPELNQVLDILIEAGQEFTEQRNAAVFSKFCSSLFEAIPLHIIADRVEAEFATVISALEQANQNASQYGDTLQAAETRMGQLTSPKQLVQLLNGMLSQTRAMSKQSREVEGQLRQSWSEISKLRDELEGARREAMTDALTGLANRKMFDFMLREAAMEAMETDEPLALLFLDIDYFKAFNDNHGHHVGDQVLKLLASVLKDTCKGQDTPARYGGEEFAVILPRTRVSDAAKLAESIRQRLAGKSIVHRKTGEQLGRIMVSVGVAGFVFGEPLRQLVERCDHALYTAKRTGRNKVVVDACAEKTM
jgi:diguanylate cyclase